VKALLKSEFIDDKISYTILSTSLPMKGTALSVEHEGVHIGSAKVDSVEATTVCVSGRQVGIMYSLYLEFTFGSSLNVPDGLYNWKKLT